MHKNVRIPAGTTYGMPYGGYIHHVYMCLQITGDPNAKKEEFEVASALVEYKHDTCQVNLLDGQIMKH